MKDFKEVVKELDNNFDEFESILGTLSLVKKHKINQKDIDRLQLVIDHFKPLEKYFKQHFDSFKNQQSKDADMIDFYNGVDEVVLTDSLINELVLRGLGEKETFIKMRESGAKWNTKRLSFVWDAEEF